MISKLTLKNILDSQRERLSKTSLGLPRKVSGFQNLSTHAFIVTGIRRCGKSTVLQQINIEFGEPSFCINFEDPRLAGFDLSDFNRLQEIAEKNKVETYCYYSAANNS